MYADRLEGSAEWRFDDGLPLFLNRHTHTYKRPHEHTQIRTSLDRPFEVSVQHADEDTAPALLLRHAVDAPAIVPRQDLEGAVHARRLRLSEGHVDRPLVVLHSVHDVAAVGGAAGGVGARVVHRGAGDIVTIPVVVRPALVEHGGELPEGD